MKRQDFIKNVASRLENRKGIVGTQENVAEILDAIETEVFAVMKQEDFAPFKFGKIGGKHVDAKEGRNPQTGEKIMIAEKIGYPYFKASSVAKGK